jgi:hypothetical protein
MTYHWVCNKSNTICATSVEGTDHTSGFTLGFYWGSCCSVFRNQRAYQNPYIEEEQTIQWTKEKTRQKDKQQSTKRYTKTED